MVVGRVALLRKTKAVVDGKRVRRAITCVNPILLKWFITPRAIIARNKELIFPIALSVSGNVINI